MAKEKEIKEEVKVETTEAPKEKSQAYKDFEKIIEVYKKQNPKKYEIKKVELANKLAKL